MQNTNTSKIMIGADVAERLKADFLAEDTIKTQTQDIYRLSYRGKRFYILNKYNEVVKGASVTNIIRATTPTPFGIIEWRQRHGDYADTLMADSASYGTFMHRTFGDLILGHEFPMAEFKIRDLIMEFIASNEGMANPLDMKSWIEKIKQDVFGYIAWCKDYDPEPVAIEYPFVFDGDYPYGGSIDLIVKIKADKKKPGKEMVLVDYKSSRKDTYESYIIQTFAYLRGWNQANPKDRIKRHFIYQPKDYRLPLGKTVTPYQFKEFTDDDACDKWDLLLQIYYSHWKEAFGSYSILGDKPVSKESTLEDMVVEVNPLGFLSANKEPSLQAAQNPEIMNKEKEEGDEGKNKKTRKPRK